MNHNEKGETSRKKTSDSCDTDRPLKKARYLWQVKGNYHLKANRKPDLTSNDTSDQDSQPEQLNNNTRKRCCDRACVEALIATSDKILEFPKQENIDKSISDEIPITLVQNEKSDDYFLRKWQARQIAKGFVDNTINRVLESWMVVPFDATDFVESCDDGGHVEDEGILMAIQSHGLQSGNSAILSRKSSILSAKSSNTFPNLPESACTCSRTQTEPVLTIPFHQRPESTVDLDYFPNVCVLNDQADEKDEALKINDSDFLDAAVAVAIQKKGLISYNYVDCG